MSTVAAGIVTYQPNLDRLHENILAIYKQVDKLIIVDNNSDNYKDMKNKISEFDNITLIKNEKNDGIARALNIIVDYCTQIDIEWVMLLDQDSVISIDAIDNYKKYFLLDYVALISPTIKDRNEKDNKVNELITSNYEIVDKSITSGSMINVNVNKKIGGYDENMFMDYVDFEYCYRLKKAGYKMIKMNNVVLLHQLGNLSVYNFFGIPIRITNHSPQRTYYYHKNYMYFLSKHNLSKRKYYLRLPISIIKILLFEKHKLKKILSIYNGIKDYKKI